MYDRCGDAWGLAHTSVAPSRISGEEPARAQRTGGCILWQVHLTLGPSLVSLATFCRAVRSFTSDMGTERMMNDVAACLAVFHHTMSPIEEIPSIGDMTCLFPFSICMPGFRHQLDTVLQRGLSSMRGFPSFLMRLKSIVRFLRQETVRSEIARCLRRDGQPGLAGLIAEK